MFSMQNWTKAALRPVTVFQFFFNMIKQRKKKRKYYLVDQTIENISQNRFNLLFCFRLFFTFVNCFENRHFRFDKLGTCASVFWLPNTMYT